MALQRNQACGLGLVQERLVEGIVVQEKRHVHSRAHRRHDLVAVETAGAVDGVVQQLRLARIARREFGDAAFGVTADQVAARPGWNVMTAVRTKAIRPVDGDLVTRPGPRILDGLRLELSPDAKLLVSVGTAAREGCREQPLDLGQLAVPADQHGVHVSQITAWREQLQASAANVFGGVWETGAGAIFAENEALGWLVELLGWPHAAGGGGR